MKLNTPDSDNYEGVIDWAEPGGDRSEIYRGQPPTHWPNCRRTTIPTLRNSYRFHRFVLSLPFIAIGLVGLLFVYVATWCALKIDPDSPLASWE